MRISNNHSRFLNEFPKAMQHLVCPNTNSSLDYIHLRIVPIVVHSRNYHRQNDKTICDKTK